jgi:hypothetical protein
MPANSGLSGQHGCEPRHSPPSNKMESFHINGYSMLLNGIEIALSLAQVIFSQEPP